MPEMHTVAHFSNNIPGATAAEMQEAERLMRNPEYVAEVMEKINETARKYASRSGFPHPIEITGTIHSVTHHP
jgi:hypothetical protein